MVDPESEPRALEQLTRCRLPSMNSSRHVWGPSYGVSLVRALFLSGTIILCGQQGPICLLFCR